ncbi:MAG TPA: hypothetical protein VNX27_10875 [Chthoniobacterales bacterium]|jgi:hypothetical protein|nr:hypothetical protein [Chthoniobacterales bacterium]
MRVSRLVGLGLVLFPTIDLSGGNSNSGHDYGTNLSDNEKHDVMEYLKTL